MGRAGNPDTLSASAESGQRQDAPRQEEEVCEDQRLMERLNPELESLELALACVPTHRDPPISKDALARRLADSLGLGPEGSEAWADATVALLRLLGVLEEASGAMRLSGQIPRYFIESLRWYLRAGLPILSNWNRPGTAKDVGCDSIPDMAPYFLKALERRRLDRAAIGRIDPEASRSQAAAVLLIRSDLSGEPVFLHQWDGRALQYQLIGGRKRGSELLAQTASRELCEEITEQELLEARDFSLTMLHPQEQPIRWSSVSRTYGALTTYQFWLFGVTFAVESLELSALDRWITVSEMRKGTTVDGKRVGDPEVVRLFDSVLSSGLEGVDVSIDVSQIRGLAEYIDMKPGWLGFSFDLKRWLGDLRSRSGKASRQGRR